MAATQRVALLDKQRSCRCGQRPGSDPNPFNYPQPFNSPTHCTHRPTLCATAVHIMLALFWFPPLNTKGIPLPGWTIMDLGEALIFATLPPSHHLCVTCTPMLCFS